ncbi:hypothetical protein C8J57DRAFT_1441105 [Mycena rebaudengoi]|nr:hypothetical protein C8J57DRAFT_1441105 [Mycena rebaudengoi]
MARTQYSTVYNPQQAESASNARVKSNLWCRYDLAGGVQDTVDELQTSTGVKDKTALFWERLIQDPRLKDKIKGDARKAVKTRIKDLIQWELYNWVILQPEARSSKLSKDSCAPMFNFINSRSFSCIQSQLNVADCVQGITIIFAQRQRCVFPLFFSISLDPHQDSPCEILHSILLGEDKYVWHETNSAWDKTKGDRFAVRLQSSSTDGLNMSSLRGQYIVKYKNALIGKHFKVLQQLGAFHLHQDLYGKNLFDLWKASGELGALLRHPEIRNQEQYLRDLQICIDNVLDLWRLIDPVRIMTKYKLHVLPHLPGDVRHFGLPILYATEGFEGWNGVFRLCSILSNHQAPSHDIGITLADMEGFKHQASGGWWKPAGSQAYIQAGHEIIAFLHRNKELQRRLSWMDKIKPKPGSIKLQSRRNAISGPWRDVLGPL